MSVSRTRRSTEWCDAEPGPTDIDLSARTTKVVVALDCSDRVPMDAQFFVYILASKKNGTLYVGLTNDLVRRLEEHKAKLVPGFTRKYGVDRLVYFEAYESILEARAREHSLKRWRRAWKIALIEKDNPEWRDLSDQLNA